ncbi:MAG: hypothetical protein C0592_11265 [Marinilabiliales bacterium]|nr:MAG: hypothetical protein C0592_11265 [Marinilabiliales bacterium]
MIKLYKTYRPLITIALLLITFTGNTQNEFTCPWDEVNCPGKCGAYYDADGDGYCDYGRVDKPEVKDTTPVILPDTTTAAVNNETGPENNQAFLDTTTSEKANDSINTDTSGVSNTETDGNSTKKVNTPPGRPKYTLIFVSALVFGLYFLTHFLSKTKVLRKCNHRRIWNILLTLTFLGSGVLGIVLVIQLNYNIWMGIYRDFLYWHVEFGIAMGLIGILHALWHWKYFKNLFSGWKNKNVCN